MGRWQQFYERFLDVNEPPFVGSVHVAYQTLIPLSGNVRPKAFPAWERLVIWKSRNSENALCAQIPHVNADLCLKKLVRANLQGANGASGRLVSLYLTDYAEGREVFEVLDGNELPEDRRIVGLPYALVESDEVHANHPSSE